jgi:succinate dehydrogenase / fumarate reductase cytochrome b subunit
MDMADAPASASRRERPLSPFISVYRWPVTMLTSIVHRVTGVGLAAGAVILAWWLIATAAGPNAYASFAAVAGSWFGKLVLFGFTWALIYHLLNGIRHLVWDFGFGFEKNRAERTGMIVIVLSVILTIAIWTIVYIRGGAF